MQFQDICYSSVYASLQQIVSPVIGLKDLFVQSKEGILHAPGKRPCVKAYDSL